ncbi:MAG: sugar phosphate isomerase/epimerase [Planctomycetota bacterium]|jgi:D-psicose/D-tagatose/L-ribulose 3-epimerase|nr:sugar phosphate isomerase/epimerase [Planctomycetota bacterium]
MNNQLGAYFTYWVEKYNTDYDICLKKAAALGFQAVGLRGTGVVEFSDAKKDATRRLAEDLGLKLIYIVATADYDLSSEDAGVRQKAVDYLLRIIKAVAHMKGDLLGGSFYSPWHSSLPAGVTDKRPWLERSAAGMREICRAAGDHGIGVTLEILNRYESCLLNTAAEGMDYLGLAGCGNLGLLLDTFHMNIEEKTLPGAIAAAGDRLTHFHVGEADRDVPGPGGHINWGEIFAALKGIGYRGIIEFEPFVVMGTEIGRNVRLWRDLSGGLDLDEKLRRSLEFVRGEMARAG